jgi:hypothetical protein
MRLSTDLWCDYRGAWQLRFIREQFLTLGYAAW